MNTRIWLAIGVAALGWGTSGVAQRAALADGIPPVAMVAMRSLMATILLIALVRLSGRPLPNTRQAWKLGVVMGLLNLAVPFVTMAIALQFASAGFVGLIIALIPLATAVLAHFSLDNEPLHGAKTIGLLAGLGGVVVLLLSGDSGIGAAGRPVLAASLSIVGVLAISYAGIYAKKHQTSYDPMVLTGLQFAVGFVLIALFMLAYEGMPPSVTPWGWFLLLYLTIPGSVMPFLLFYWVLQRTTTTIASLTAYVVPLIALISGIVILDERLEFGIAIGGALIMVGVVLVNRADRRLQASPTVV
ncbi:MAG: DMT family transporter [Acidimicrobiia bacterium]|nr:DMT family transporter [Acidimicrobiia bacterium]